MQHYIDISGLDSYDKFYLEHISCRWELDYLRESIREEMCIRDRKMTVFLCRRQAGPRPRKNPVPMILNDKKEGCL